jgi:hypothetical protein
MTFPKGKRPHNYSHGLTGTPLYRSWAMMIQRCKNKKLAGWPNYGGRGIKVCKRWLKFENFIADMGVRPKGTSLDRIDNDDDYKPSNCRWATRSQQAKNTRAARLITYQGRTMNLVDWANELGLDTSTLIYRIAHHGDEEAIRRGGPAGQRDFITRNRTGLRGVGKRGRGYFAQIQNRGRVIGLGTFDTAEAAHQAYLQARAKFDGERA